MSDEKKDKIILTFNQVRELGAELVEVGREMFLVKRKAIKVDKDGQWSIMAYEGLGAAGMEACYGYTYATDIPYTFWSEVLKQVDYYLYRKEQKEKDQVASLEATAEQVV